MHTLVTLVSESDQVADSCLARNMSLLPAVLGNVQASAELVALFEDVMQKRPVDSE